LGVSFHATDGDVDGCAAADCESRCLRAGYADARTTDSHPNGYARSAVTYADPTQPDTRSTDEHGYAFTVPHPQPLSHKHGRGESYADPNPYRDCQSDPDAKRDGDGDCYRDDERYTDEYGNGDRDGNGNADGNLYADNRQNHFTDGFRSTLNTWHGLPLLKNLRFHDVAAGLGYFPSRKCSGS
jgi:hypothetical protein